MEICSPAALLRKQIVIAFKQYPKEAPRASEMSEERDYSYRPESDTGSNEFQRYGPDLDEKVAAVSY